LSWGPDQDELKVFYSSNDGSTWTQLADYTSSVSSWTERTLAIPTASATSRIAFEGNAKYGYGVCLDDIQVTGIPASFSEVSVSATDATASEVNQEPGTWTITRIVNTTGALSVTFTLNGSATKGSDYNADTSSPISFAAGETSKVVTLTPVDDTVLAEWYEVATLTLTAGTGYVIDAAADDISIYDDEGFDLNVLVIGSTHSFSEGGENDVVHEKPFTPTTIATHLQGILSQDPALSGTVKVFFEDVFKTKTNRVQTSGSGINDVTAHCYSLAQHFMWPDEKVTRLANLRGEAGTQWDYIVICNDPYIMANFPGMYAEGVKLIQKEVAQSSNAITPQVILMAQWPENSSSFTADDFNEVAHRVGSSSGLTVVPAGKAWDSYTSQDTNAAHPTPRGEYLAAASIYSKLYSRSAKTSRYSYASDGDNIADHALSVVQASASVAQYSGTYAANNPFQMKYVTKRVVSYRHTGTSTERGLAQALGRLDDVHRITLNTTAVNGKWDFNYGRGNDGWEDEKDYEVDPLKYDRSYGFPMHHYNTNDAPYTMPYGIDKYYYGDRYEDGTDLGIAYNMIRPNTRELSLPEDVRAIPIRLMWLKMEQASPGFNPLGDNTHMHPNLNDASAAFMYTLLSGRCPVVEEPATQGSAAWMQWLGHKVGYETAWQMSHLTTRAPGFRVLPSSTSAKTVTPSTTETMTVQFLNPPQSDVTVTVTCSSATAAIVGPKTLTFTPSNYNTPQQVVVAGIPGASTSESFDVVFTTASNDQIYDGLSDSWGYTTTRSSTVTVTQVDNGTSSFTAIQNTAIDINLNASGANAGNTVFSGPLHGSIVWSGAGVIEYTPDNGYEGGDQIVYAATVGSTQTIGCLDISVEVPNGQINATASDASASEEGPDDGSFTITRVGNSSGALNVLFSMSGTATLGTDYTLSHTSPVTIPAGQISVVVTLTPIDDSVFGERDEFAVLNITPNAAYPIGSGSASITIADNDNNAPTADAGLDQTAIWQNVTTTPGLYSGSVAGDLNDSAQNPETEILVDVSSQTENAIAGNTTEIYTGYIYNADGQISFTEHIDDKARIWIDDILVLTNDAWSVRSSTANLNLTPGWHSIEIRISNGSGGSGAVSGVGIGYDPTGGTTWQALVDPGDGSFLRVNANSTGAVTSLNASASDLDNDPLTYLWIDTLTGTAAGNAVFSDSTSLTSMVTFTEPGTYILRLAVSDGQYQSSDDITITVHPAPSAIYSSWAGGSFSNAFTTTDPDQNQDGDAMSNMMEFAFGTDPTVSDGGSLAIDGSAHGLPVLMEASGSILDLVFVRRDDHGTSGSLSYTAQFSSDLGIFYDSAVSPTMVSDSSADSDYEVVKVAFPTMLPNGKQARFGRIMVSQAE
jgi:hypothetical protein